MQNIYVEEFFSNKILMVTFASWIIAQTLKVVLGVIREKRFDFRWFLGTGGMPSSHSSGMATLATTVGLEFGFDSIFFALAASLAIVVMFDAQGVRRATGRQARILNKITEDIYWQGKISEGRLRELVGHTPVEVFMGMLLGIAIGVAGLAVIS